MVELGETALAADAKDERATFEALAETLQLDQARDVSLGATLRRGTLVARRSEPFPRTRGQVARALSEGVTLPHLDVATGADDTTGADLELIHALGEGGMGVVWLARQRSLAREVAVKRLKSDGGSSSGAAALLAEARATGSLEHPSIVPVHALGVASDGSPLLVMKRIEGESLEALIRDRAHPGWPALERRYGDHLTAVVEILVRVADALELAHARGLVHRDIKPENIMVGRFGEVYLVDWGIALWPEKLDDEELATVGIVGTPSFMAPEMVRGDARAIDARTDVYLLGSTLHAALTGTPRHAGHTLPAVLMASLVSAPFVYEPALGELGELANRATSKDPNDRPQSAVAFREALTDFVRHRASARLVDEARQRLDEIAAVGSPETLASPEATRALTEGRFAFTQALREWPGNAPAQEGLARTLRSMIESELHRRSPDAADALARELSPKDEALDARITALRAELAESRRLEHEARTEARERDPVRTAKQRAWIAAGLILLTIVLVTLGWTSEVSHAGARPMTEVLVFDAVLLSFAGAVVWLFRARLLSNRLGRQTAASLVLALLAGTVSDGLLLLRGADTHQAGSASMLAMGCVLAGAAIGIDARFGWSAAAFLVGAIACALWPAVTVLAVGAAAIAATTVVLIDSLSQARAGKRREPG